MRSRAPSYLARVACVISAAALLVFGPIGCGDGSSTAAGTSGELPPEVKQGRKNMQDFVKSQKSAKSKSQKSANSR
jgi:hypothetical protein